MGPGKRGAVCLSQDGEGRESWPQLPLGREAIWVGSRGRPLIGPGSWRSLAGLQALHLGPRAQGLSPGSTCLHPDLGHLPRCLPLCTSNMGIMEAVMMTGASYIVSPE